MWNSYELRTKYKLEESGIPPSPNVSLYAEITLPAGHQRGGIFSHFGPKCFLKEKSCSLSLFPERLVFH